MESLHNSSTSIKNWAIDDRPREKLLSKGKESLSDSELLAILINSGSGKDSATWMSWVNFL
jgi:DNA repair protein RadC